MCTRDGSPLVPKSLKGAKEQDEEDEEAGSCDAQEAGPSTSVPAASAAAVAAPLPVAPPRAAPSERYASELEMLCSEFPSFDRELLKSLLEDQAGDVLDVRAMLRVRAWRDLNKGLIDLLAVHPS